MNANMREVCQAIADDWKTRYSQAGEVSDGEFEFEFRFMLRKMEIAEETEERTRRLEKNLFSV